MNSLLAVLINTNVYAANAMNNELHPPRYHATIRASQYVRVQLGFEHPDVRELPVLGVKV